MEVKVTKTNNDIYDLEKDVAELKKRVNAQERYTSKDTLIFRNFDLDPRLNSLSEDFCQLVKNIFSYYIEPFSIKAIHRLPVKNENNRGTKSAPIIVKFVYFADKDNIYQLKSRLAACFNSHGEKMYFTERLPQYGVTLKQKCESLGLITTTMNCQVKLYYKANNESFCSKHVDSVSEIEKAANSAIKRDHRDNVYNYPNQGRNESNSKPFSKRNLLPRFNIDNASSRQPPPTPHQNKRSHQEITPTRPMVDGNTCKQHINEDANKAMSTRDVTTSGS